ncbi:MAG: efflux RND transporter periplasmic adaptor subunit [Nevskia sp.]
MKIGFGFNVVISLAASVLAACSRPPAQAEEVRPVRTIVAQPAAADLDNVFAGEVRPRYQSELGFRVAGKISERLVNVGDPVKAGQLLARLDPKDLSLNEASSRAGVTAQEAQFAVEKADLDRYAKLLEQGFVSKAEYDRQQTKFKAAQAQLESVRAQARVSSNQTGYAELRADHGGTIVSIDADAGKVVAAGQVVMQLAQSGEMEVATDVPEQLVGGLKVGQTVSLSLWTADGKTYAGVLRELSSSADAATRTYRARIRIENPPPGMRLGMTASVRIPRGGIPDLIHIPLTAFTERDGRQGLWILDAGASIVHFREAKALAFAGNEALLGDGVKPGEIVVTAGAGLLKEGQKVYPLAAVAAR